MAKIRANRSLGGDFYLLEVECGDRPAMGQFYMLRAWTDYPVLSRPISVFDADGETVSFLYKVVGKGTERFSRLADGEEITLLGPLGNGFPAGGKAEEEKVALVGGGVGIAPLYLTARQLKIRNPRSRVDLYLGFSGEPILVDRYCQVADRVAVNVGGFVTDEVDPAGYDRIFTCGPEPMMGALYAKCADAGVGDRLYVSVENRMACGFGACLVCTCKTAGGNKKACKDGPVFRGEEVYGL